MKIAIEFEQEPQSVATRTIYELKLTIIVVVLNLVLFTFSIHFTGEF